MANNLIFVKRTQHFSLLTNQKQWIIKLAKVRLTDNGSIQFSGDNLFHPHRDLFEAQDCILNILFLGCDEAH